MSVVVKRFCKTSVQSTYVDTLLRMAYDILYKNAVVHGCMWYKQNVAFRCLLWVTLEKRNSLR